MDFIEVSGKTVEEAVTEASVQLGTVSDRIEYEVVQEGNTGLFGFNSKPAIIRARVKSTPEDQVKKFLSDVFMAMHMDVKIEILDTDEENTISINLKGDDMGVLIGKRGQTLDSLQYLANLALNKHSDHFIRVKLDTEDYRSRRQKTLENLAKNIAYKVKRTKKDVSLEPMNPYERRIIHCALQSDKYVETHSEGEEPYRHVVVTLKK